MLLVTVVPTLNKMLSYLILLYCQNAEDYQYYAEEFFAMSSTAKFLVAENVLRHVLMANIPCNDRRRQTKSSDSGGYLKKKLKKNFI